MNNAVTPAENLTETLRAKAQESLFFTATALLGFKDLTAHLHYEMCRVAENASLYKRLCAVVPRNHFKTSLFSITYAVWRGIRNPNETGLILMNNATNAERVVSRVRAAFENAPLLRQLFPELTPEKSRRWNKEEACLPRTADHPEATWTAAGWSTKVTSGHWDWMVCDDLVDEDSYESPDQMSKLVDRFEQREALLRPPIPARELIVVGNHWSNIDLICHIYDKHPEYFIYYRQAIENGLPIFPEKYTLDWLLRKQKADPYLFATQWMNNPADEALSELKREWILEYKRRPDGIELPTNEYVPFGHMRIYGAVDMRHSLANKASDKMSSRNAIVIAGIDHKGRRFLLDEWASRCDPLTLVKQMLAMWLRWYPHGLIKLGLESYGYQKALQPLALEIWKNEDIKPVLELLPQDTKKSKEARCRGGTNFFRQGLGYIHYTHVLFKEEYCGFPGGRTMDVLDAWSWCQHLMQAPDEPDLPMHERVRDHAYYQQLQSSARI